MQPKALQLRLEAVNALENVLERQLIVVVLQAEVRELRRLSQRIDERLKVGAAHAVNERQPLQSGAACQEREGGVMSAQGRFDVSGGRVYSRAVLRIKKRHICFCFECVYSSFSSRVGLSIEAR